MTLIGSARSTTCWDGSQGRSRGDERGVTVVKEVEVIKEDSTYQGSDLPKRHGDSESSKWNFKTSKTRMTITD